MRTTAPFVRLAALLVGGGVAATCFVAAMSRLPARASGLASLTWPLQRRFEPRIKQPALVAVSGQTNGLEYWPINPRGSSKPRSLSGPLSLGYASLVANGDVVFAAMESPAQILAYNVKTEAQSTLSDPFGTPIDIAIGKDASLYLINLQNGAANVAWYPKGSGQPVELTCKLIDLGEAIAVDNEGDVFVQGYGKRFAGVIEFPNGASGLQSGNCHKLPLISENSDYVAGIVIDPKTDALVTLDNPDLCAGGYEGRMTVYPKPYRAKTSSSVILGGNCTGGLRLNADSTLVFYGDESVSGGFTYIDSSTYPAGQPLGVYSEGGSFSGPGPGGFTTIPNTLPN